MPGTSNSGGRNAKATAVHLLQGTFRADRHGNSLTPDPPAGVPPPPKALAGVARAEWERMVERLTHAGTLSVVDDAALYQYVQLFAETERLTGDQARLQKLSKELRRGIQGLEGATLVAAVEEVVKLEQLMAKHTAQLRAGHDAIRKWLVEFGMTPAARTRVGKVPPVADPIPANPLEKYLARRRT